MNIHTRLLSGVVIAVPLLCFLVAPVRTPVPGEHVAASDHAGAAPPAMPIAFVRNRGQWNGRARFRAEAGPVTAWVIDDGWRLDVAGGDRGVVVDMRFENTDAPSAAVAEAASATSYNWLVGPPSDWVTGLDAHDRVRLPDLYPGVDVVLREQDGHLEYDLVLAPGARLDRVAVRCDGIDAMRLDRDGSLVLETELGALRQKPPLTWATDDSGARDEIPCRYVVLGDDRFGFAADGWDGDTELTIDPGLVWSTMLGGSGQNAAHAVAVTPSGEAIVVGETESTDFPTTPGAFERSYQGGQRDAFVAKFADDGSLLFSTYLGGDLLDVARSVHVDSQGVITVGGETNSATFPTTADAYDRRPAVRADDVFVARLDPTGSQLLYSTYFGDRGTNAFEDLGGLCVDESRGWIYLAGVTNGTGLPLSPDAFQATHSGGSLTEGYVSILDLQSQPNTTVLHYSTYIGGRGFERISAPGVDAAGIVTFGGDVRSGEFVTTSGAFQTSVSGGHSGFACRLDPGRPGAAGLLWSSYVTGSGDETFVDARADANGIVTVAGATTSGNFPTTPGALQGTLAALSDGFVARLDPSQTGDAQLVYGTYLGGANLDRITAIALRTDGLVTVAGRTDSNDFPTTPGALLRRQRSNGNLFLARLDLSQAGAQALVYSTLFGGCSQFVEVEALALDPTGSIATIVGSTSGRGVFPTTPGAFQRTENGGRPAFVSRIELRALPPAVTPFGTTCAGSAGVPALVPLDPPEVCLTYRVELQNALPSSSAVLLFGASDTDWGGTPLPLDLGFIDMPGCFLLTDPTIIVPFATGSGTTTVSFSVPRTSLLIHSRFYNQCLIVDPGANSLGVVATNGLAATIRI